MSARIEIKRTVNEFGGRKIDVNPDWVVTEGDKQFFQHPDNDKNTFNGEEVEDASVKRTWKVMNGEEVVDPDFMWDDITFEEAANTETLYGGSWSEFREGFRNDSAKAQRLFILLLLKRKDARTRISAVDKLKINDFAIVFEDEDVPREADPSSGAPDVPGSETDSGPTPEPSLTTSE